MNLIIEIIIIFIIFHLKDIVVKKLKVTENGNMKIFLKAVILLAMMIIIITGILLSLSAIAYYKRKSMKIFLKLLIISFVYISSGIVILYKLYKIIVS